MATTPLVSVDVAMRLAAGVPPVIEFPEAASQTFKAGELVYLSGGYVTECGDNPVAILGFALKDALNGSAACQQVPVLIADPNTVFRANYCSAAATGVATALNIVGRAAALFRDTTNSKTQVSNSGLDGSNARVIIVGLDPQDTVGDTGGRVFFKFKNQYSQMFCTS